MGIEALLGGGPFRHFSRFQFHLAWEPWILGSTQGWIHRKFCSAVGRKLRLRLFRLLRVSRIFKLQRAHWISLAEIKDFKCYLIDPHCFIPTFANTDMFSDPPVSPSHGMRLQLVNSDLWQLSDAQHLLYNVMIQAALNGLGIGYCFQSN